MLASPPPRPGKGEITAGEWAQRTKQMWEGIAMPDPTRDIDVDNDEDGTDAAAIQRRLNRVIGILQKASNRMDAIQRGWTAPGPPDQPPIAALLSTVATTAQHAADVANALKATFTPR